MRHFAAALFLLVLLSCGRSPEAAQRMVVADMDVSEAKNGGFERIEAAATAATMPPVDRKIVRTGELRFEVGDLDAARATILQQVAGGGGYVEGDDRSTWANALAMTLRVRIPADKFDAFVNGLQGLGELENQSISANDVTAQWVDVEARLGAKKEVEKRYLEIVTQARTVTEVLEVERELGNVRADIESMEAQMRGLKDQVAMSTLTITCTKPQASNEAFNTHFGVAVKEGWNNLVRFLVGVLYIWPFVLVGTGLLWWLVRRRKAKRQVAART